jgi:hypothetical protein
MSDLSEIFQELSGDFDKLTQDRHDEGAKEYGVFTFLGNDVIRMMAEELADTANYCRYQFIKLMLLQDSLVTQLEEKGLAEGALFGPDNAKASFDSFRGVGEFGWKKS